jgi:hypothetical protein
MQVASWRSIGFLSHAIVLATLSQMAAPSLTTLATFGFLLAGLLFLWGLWPERDPIPARPEATRSSRRPLLHHRPLKWVYLAVATVFLAIAYGSFGDNTFTVRGVVFWLVGLMCFLLAVWERPMADGDAGEAAADTGGSGRSNRPSRHRLALAAVILLAVIFRFHDLEITPIEMTSDHAEKLLDVNDVLDGDRPIFFPRNTGREAFQFYLTALLIWFTPLQVSHLALKVGTGIFGVLAIPFTYMLGRELFNRHVGLFAAVLMAIGHWHVAITRVGLRFPFTAAFATPALYFLFRAIRLDQRRDWILVGAFLGIGLHTYIPMRIVPLLLVLLCLTAFGFDVHGRRKDPSLRPPSLQIGFWHNALIGAVTSFILFLPLFRFMMDEPDLFWTRAASRAVPENLSFGAIAEIFVRNLRDAALMFNVIGDVVAVNTIGRSPVLGWLTGGLFVLGLVFLLWSALRDGDRRPVYLLVSLFVLLLPSTLSIQYPAENPSVVRMGGAPPVVMLIAALPLAIWWKAARRASEGRGPIGRFFAPVGVTVLLAAGVAYNYHWYFVRYHDQILGSLLNSRDLGALMRRWVEAGGYPRNVYQLGYPQWIDTRLIAIHAGQLPWHNVLWKFESLAAESNPGEGKLFFLSPEDNEGLNKLKELYPAGRWKIDPSSTPGLGTEFVVFEVPAEGSDLVVVR